MADLEGSLLKSDKATLVVSAETDDTLRILYPGWDDAKIIRKGEWLEIKNVRGQVNAFRRGKHKAKVSA